MYKRLTISLVLMGLAAFSLAAAFAYFSDSGEASVSITAGSADLKFDLDQDCDGQNVLTGLETAPDTLTWSGVVPGDQSSDCITVLNDGDGALDVYLKHSAWSGTLLGHVTFNYATYVDGDTNATTPMCAAVTASANHHRFTNDNSGRGCYLGTLQEGEHLNYMGTATFVDNGNNQNSLDENASPAGTLGLDITITGYTG